VVQENYLQPFHFLFATFPGISVNVTRKGIIEIGPKLEASIGAQALIVSIQTRWIAAGQKILRHGFLILVRDSTLLESLSSL
jgi:hypothetical protein